MFLLTKKHTLHYERKTKTETIIDVNSWKAQFTKRISVSEIKPMNNSNIFRRDF